MTKILISLAVLSLLLSLGNTLTNTQLFLLSDQALFDFGVKQDKVLGGCYIQNTSAACSHYGKYRHPNGTILGLPDSIGTGCLGLGCWGPPNTYQNYQNTVLSICSGNVVKDGANMLRIGILNGYCGTTCPQVNNGGSGTIPVRPVRPLPVNGIVTGFPIVAREFSRIEEP